MNRIPNIRIKLSDKLKNQYSMAVLYQTKIPVRIVRNARITTSAGPRYLKKPGFELAAEIKEAT